MPKYRVTYRNGFHRDFTADSETQAHDKALAEYRAWLKRHPKAPDETSGHQVAGVKRVQ